MLLLLLLVVVLVLQVRVIGAVMRLEGRRAAGEHVYVFSVLALLFGTDDWWSISPTLLAVSGDALLSEQPTHALLGHIAGRNRQRRVVAHVGRVEKVRGFVDRVYLRQLLQQDLVVVPCGQQPVRRRRGCGNVAELGRAELVDEEDGLKETQPNGERIADRSYW